MNCQRCDNGKNRYALYDARGIFVSYICEDCEDQVRKRYRMEIFTNSDYACDEPIDEE